MGTAPPSPTSRPPDIIHMFPGLPHLFCSCSCVYYTKCKLKNKNGGGLGTRLTYVLEKSHKYHLVVTTMCNTCMAHCFQDCRGGFPKGSPLALLWHGMLSIRGIVTLVSNSWVIPYMREIVVMDVKSKLPQRDISHLPHMLNKMLFWQINPSRRIFLVRSLACLHNC